MNKLRVLALCVFLACSSCGGATTPNLALRDASVSANSTANTVEALQSIALILYRIEQEIAIQSSVNLGENREQARERVLVVRKAWLPVWESFSFARAVHTKLTAIISSSAQSDEEMLQSVVNDDINAASKAAAQLSIARLRIQGGVQK